MVMAAWRSIDINRTIVWIFLNVFLMYLYSNETIMNFVWKSDFIEKLNDNGIFLLEQD